MSTARQICHALYVTLLWHVAACQAAPGNNDPNFALRPTPTVSSQDIRSPLALETIVPLTGETTRRGASLVSLSKITHCADVYNGTQQAGNRIQLFTCNGMAAAQAWNIGGGQVSIGSPALCMTASLDGKSILLDTCDAASRKLWTFEGGQIRNSALGNCLSLPQAPADELALTTMACDPRSPWQYWGVANHSGTSVVGVGVTSAGNPNRCMDIKDGSSAAGTEVRVWPCNTTQAQQWVLQGASIQGLGQCLQAVSQSGASGLGVGLMPCSSKNVLQQWSLDLGRMRLVATGACLALVSPTSDATQLVLADCSNDIAQQWIWGNTP